MRSLILALVLLWEYAGMWAEFNLLIGYVGILDIFGVILCILTLLYLFLYFGRSENFARTLTKCYILRGTALEEEWGVFHLYGGDYRIHREWKFFMDFLFRSHVTFNFC